MHPCANSDITPFHTSRLIWTGTSCLESGTITTGYLLWLVGRHKDVWYLKQQSVEATPTAGAYSKENRHLEDAFMHVGATAARLLYSCCIGFLWSNGWSMVDLVILSIPTVLLAKTRCFLLSPYHPTVLYANGVVVWWFSLVSDVNTNAFLLSPNVKDRRMRSHRIQLKWVAKNLLRTWEFPWVISLALLHLLAETLFWRSLGDGIELGYVQKCLEPLHNGHYFFLCGHTSIFHKTNKYEGPLLLDLFLLDLLTPSKYCPPWTTWSFATVNFMPSIIECTSARTIGQSRLAPLGIDSSTSITTDTNVGSGTTTGTAGDTYKYWRF